MTRIELDTPRASLRREGWSRVILRACPGLPHLGAAAVSEIPCARFIGCMSEKPRQTLSLASASCRGVRALAAGRAASVRARVGL